MPPRDGTYAVAVSLIDSDRFQQALGRRLRIVDGGARGHLEPPLDRISPEHRTVARFEPDAAADVTAGDQVIRKALWSHAETLTLHVTAEPSCSSIYPPDMTLVERFIDPVGAPARTVVDKIQVEGAAIDEVFPAADFVKLDVHSAEYEALVGAERALRSTVSGVLVEAWPVPIHEGQHTAAEVELLLAGHGFLPFDITVGRWQWRTGGSQAVQTETLYLFDIRRDPRRALTVAGFAHLFGHVGYARAAGETAGVHIEYAVGASRIATLRSRLACRAQRSLDRYV